jgi:phosphoserine phosphatase RsbU/P
MRYRTKMILVIGSGLLISVLAIWLTALLSINNVSKLASDEIYKGLTVAEQRHLFDYLQANVNLAEWQLNRAVADVKTLATTAQLLEDKKSELAPLYEAASQIPLLKDNLQLNPSGGWYQNSPDQPSAVSVMPYLLAPNGQIKPEVTASIKQSALLNLFFPAVQKYGTPNIRVNYTSAPEIAYIRTAPWNDYAGGLARINPQTYKERNLWGYLPPGILDTWRKWATQPDVKAKLTSEVTFSTPYVDYATGKLIMTVFHPIWDVSRTKVAGSVSINLSLEQITGLVEKLKIADTGFAFLSESNGNVLAIPKYGENLLGLEAKVASAGGYQGLIRYLQDTKVAAVRQIKLPVDQNSTVLKIQINGRDQVVVLQRLAPLNFMGNPTEGIKPTSWLFGFVVPEEELLVTLNATQNTLNENNTRTVTLIVIISIVTFLVVILVLFWFSGRMTKALSQLATAAGAIEKHDYDFKVNIRTKDEFNKLGQTFNHMAQEIKHYTANLEELVEERTKQLAEANREISLLNAKLSEENGRMRAELEISRQLQEMILPKRTELEAIKELEIACFMQPADEIGGDYYDVLPFDKKIKIAVGDVTGHGLESGVLMLMVQTALRTLQFCEAVDPQDYLKILNQTIYSNVQRIRSNRNLSLVLLDYHQGDVTLQGQHEDVIVIRQDGTLELVSTLELGFAIGLEADISGLVNQAKITLNDDDVLILFTDGITEAENMQGKQYGLKRLCQVSLHSRSASANNIKEAIIADVRNYIGEQILFDDMTLVVLKQRIARNGIYN